MNSIQRKSKVPKHCDEVEAAKQNRYLNNTTDKMIKSQHCNVSTISMNKEVQELDISNFSLSDLESLHDEDPFMYYSIPGVRRAAVSLEDLVCSDVNALIRRGGGQALSPCRITTSSLSSNVGESSSFQATTTKISRQSRISFECHGIVLMEDLLLKDGDDDTSADDLDHFFLRPRMHEMYSTSIME